VIGPLTNMEAVEKVEPDINNMPRASIFDWLPYVAAARLAEDVPDDFARLLEIVHA
jgi:hypothetical protein